MKILHIQQCFVEAIQKIKKIEISQTKMFPIAFTYPFYEMTKDSFYHVASFDHLFTYILYVPFQIYFKYS